MSTALQAYEVLRRHVEQAAAQRALLEIATDQRQAATARRELQRSLSAVLHGAAALLDEEAQTARNAPAARQKVGPPAQSR